jgi:hypothetical protein
VLNRRHLGDHIYLLAQLVHRLLVGDELRLQLLHQQLGGFAVLAFEFEVLEKI